MDLLSSSNLNKKSSEGGGVLGLLGKAPEIHLNIECPYVIPAWWK
jgi:hypothetical protein